MSFCDISLFHFDAKYCFKKNTTDIFELRGFLSCLPPHPDAAKKKPVFYALVRLSASKKIVLSRELIFCIWNLEYLKAKGQTVKAGQACYKRGISRPWEDLKWIGLRGQHFKGMRAGWGRWEPRAREQMTCPVTWTQVQFWFSWFLY